MGEDRYANIATISVTMSALNTLTWQELRTNVGVAAGRGKAIAMLIDQIDYFLSAAMIAEMTTAADRIDFGVSISNAVDDLNSFTDRRIVHSGYYLRTDQGAAAAAEFALQPFSFQFFPAIPLAERSLYLGAGSVGLASAGLINARIYYRIAELTDSELLELVEVFRLVG